MKKYSKSLKLAGLTVLVLAAGILGVKTVTGITSSNSPPKVIQSGYTDSAQYCLRDCDGYIAVFSARETGAPIEVTDIETERLNDNDKKLLSVGIFVRDRVEVIRLLEDFGS